MFGGHPIFSLSPVNSILYSEAKSYLIISLPSLPVVSEYYRIKFKFIGVTHKALHHLVSANFLAIPFTLPSCYNELLCGLMLFHASGFLKKRSEAHQHLNQWRPFYIVVSKVLLTCNTWAFGQGICILTSSPHNLFITYIINHLILYDEPSVPPICPSTDQAACP